MQNGIPRKNGKVNGKWKDQNVNKEENWKGEGKWGWEVGMERKRR